MSPLDTGLALAYLVTGILFIIGLKFLSSPANARTGNTLAAIGMVIAVAATCLDQHIVTWPIIVVGGVVGAVIGFVSARAVKMTAMPQMVALFNGAGGGAAALVASGEFLKLYGNGTATATDIVPIVLSVIIGAISFAGSLVAFAKLQELMPGRPLTYPGQQIVNGLIGLAVVGLAVWLSLGNLDPAPFIALACAAALLGILAVLPIGGADMPVVISLLNSFTGVAVAVTGFVLSNTVLIISGTLVGASGTLLTMLMAKAMNRSITNVLFGAFGSVQSAAGGAAAASTGGSVRTASTEDVGTLLAYARSVIIAPGYGMAVAQAQHAVRELSANLEKRGVDVKFAIHPVAGRMPGHMNVLLAEANVPYSQLHEMDEINPQFESADVALIIGANDVTNPAARNVPSSPIYGMPILDVDKAQHVVVLKRSMNPGFAGIDNPLYENPKCMMLFGDAKATVSALAAAVPTA